MFAHAYDQLPGLGAFTVDTRSKASAGGQLEQPSEVKSSTRTARGWDDCAVEFGCARDCRVMRPALR